jgi:hypothetical protein
MKHEVSSGVTPYEFNEEQSSLIAGLGRSLRIVGMVGLAWAVVGIISMSVSAWNRGGLNIDLGPVLGLFISIWALSGGTSFINVATTQGNDIGHLMNALAKLRNVFSLIAILIVAALLIALAVMAYVLIFHPSGAHLVINGHAVG